MKKDAKSGSSKKLVRKVKPKVHSGKIGIRAYIGEDLVIHSRLRLFKFLS